MLICLFLFSYFPNLTQDLVVEDEDKNWKGICIAFLVISTIISFIVIAIMILTPSEWTPPFSFHRLSISIGCLYKWKHTHTHTDLQIDIERMRDWGRSHGTQMKSHLWRWEWSWLASHSLRANAILFFFLLHEEKESRTARTLTVCCINYSCRLLSFFLSFLFLSHSLVLHE